MGIGQSIQKMFYLPEAHTDFIFPILGEEFGLWATLSVVFIFLLFSLLLSLLLSYLFIRCNNLLNIFFRIFFL